jgi:Cysteine-rich secretory protein family
MRFRLFTLHALVLAVAGLVDVAAAYADGDNNTLIPNNHRLNDGVIANVYTIQHHAGCTNDVRRNPQLQAAAQRHARDVVSNRNLDGDIGSDGTTPQDRAKAAGFPALVSETVAINPALAISGIELINQWYSNPAYMAIMSNCANSEMGVWSENSLDRTVVVAVYGPGVTAPETAPRQAEQIAPGDRVRSENIPLGPSPDYDFSDELEHGFDWFPWWLRGVSPAPAYPSQ